MILAKVKSRVVSTAKHSHLPPRQYLRVEPMEGFEGAGENLIAIDGVQAGPGDCVLVMQEGTGAREVLGVESQALPEQSVIVAIVDQIERR